MMKPAWYVVQRDQWFWKWFNVLHWPYTIMHLSFVAIGFFFAEHLHYWRLGAALGCFALGMGVAGHALDLIAGNPLKLRIPADHLLYAAVIALALAMALAGWVIAAAGLYWLSVLALAGGFITIAYNTEAFGGRFHTDLWFTLSWGVFPALCGYFANGYHVNHALAPMLVLCYTLAWMQRVLSKYARFVRRKIGQPTAGLVVVEVMLMYLCAGTALLAFTLFAWRV